MSYVLKRSSAGDFAKAHPNHPFAHDQVSVVPSAQAGALLPVGKHGVNVSVSWGYEVHTARVSIANWRRLREGEAVTVKSKGWYEGKSFRCRWYFDLEDETSLVVCYGNDGAEGFVGQISHAEIEERPPKNVGVR